MRYSVQYGNSHTEFETDASCTVAECDCGDIQDKDSVIKQALASPIGSTGFSEFARSSNKLIFILNDGTRPTPTADILAHLYGDITGHPDVSFIIATGTHRSPTGDELRIIFGKFHDEFISRVLVHDSKNANVHVGTTSRGTPVSFSKKVMEADGIVTINSVEPHYFAGYTGGRKSFLPGVAGYESIERNHSHAAEPGAAPLALAENPVSEDMAEALDFILDKRIFSIQTVLTPHNKLYAAFAGDIRSTFSSAVETSRQIHSVEIPGKTNIVITVAQPPMDRDLYQSQKALEHGILAVEPFGIIILVSSCWDGIGDTGYYNQLLNWKDDSDVREIMGPNYRLGNHKVARLLNLVKLADIFAVTGLDDSVLATARMQGFGTLQEAVDIAVKKIIAGGHDPRILIFPGGSTTVPRTVKE